MGFAEAEPDDGKWIKMECGTCSSFRDAPRASHGCGCCVLRAKEVSSGNSCGCWHPREKEPEVEELRASNARLRRANDGLAAANDDFRAEIKRSQAAAKKPTPEDKAVEACWNCLRWDYRHESLYIETSMGNCEVHSKIMDAKTPGCQYYKRRGREGDVFYHGFKVEDVKPTFETKPEPPKLKVCSTCRRWTEIPGHCTPLEGHCPHSTGGLPADAPACPRYNLEKPEDVEET